MIVEYSVSTTVKIMAGTEDEAWEEGVAYLKERYPAHAESMDAVDCWPERYGVSGQQQFCVIVEYRVEVNE